MSSFFAPFIGLEEAFGSGFTSGSIADAIRVAEQNESSVFDFGVFAVDGINVGNLAFDVFQGLFLVSDPLTGQIIHQGATKQALQDSIERSRLLGLVGPPGPPGPPGVGGAPDFNELLTKILGSIGRLPRRRTPRGLEPVAIGGSVNVPVVRGSTADPTGTLRPLPLPGPGPTEAEKLEEFRRQTVIARGRALPAAQPAPTQFPSAREVLPSVALELLQLILRERAEKQLRDAQRRAQEIQAQRLASFNELIRRFQMGFGQQGVSLGLQGPRDSRGPLETAGVGGGFFGTLTDILIGLGTNISADLLTRLNVTRDPERREITVPNGDSEIEAALRALQTGGGAATQCGLFRGGGGTRVSSRPASVVCLPDPITGEARFFGHLGRPLVFQRDVTMAKNIPKLIRKLGGSAHRSKR